MNDQKSIKIGNARFSFGKNWQFFVEKYLDERSVEEAKKSLEGFLGRYIVRGKSFVDAGCGSGLFSLCAYKLGASKVVSFDIDEYSVKCCKYLWEKEGCPQNWQIKQGSVLDKNFLFNLGRYDIVYSWGVLHHTGDMWNAVRNILNLVNEKGLLYLAIYNKVDSFGFYSDGRFGTSHFWRRFKKLYSHSPLMAQKVIDYSVMAVLIFGCLAACKNPLKEIQKHQESRGMSWTTDIRDWLGGYPYEYATAAEVFRFIRKSGFSLENLKMSGNFRNNEYLFVNQKL